MFSKFSCTQKVPFICSACALVVCSLLSVFVLAPNAQAAPSNNAIVIDGDTCTIQDDCTTTEIRSAIETSATPITHVVFSGNVVIQTLQTGASDAPFAQNTDLESITANEGARVSFTGANQQTAPTLRDFCNAKKNLSFYESRLTNIDGLSAWDVSNVSCLAYLLNDCVSVPSLTPLANWDVSHVTGESAFASTFASMDSLTTLSGLEAWDVSNAQGNACMKNMFDSLGELTDISALSSWDVSNLTGDECLKEAFYYCSSLTTLHGLENWNVSNVQGDSCFADLFFGCADLTSIDALANWGLSNAQGTNCCSYMFCGCTSITSIVALSSWDLSNAIASTDGVAGMFDGCTKLASITVDAFMLDGSMLIPNTFDEGGDLWFSEKGSSASSGVDSDTMITNSSNVTTYGRHWQRAYSVVFDSKGGSFVAPLQVPYLNATEAIAKPENPTKDGSTFVAWYTNGYASVYDFATPVTSDFILYATWNERTATWNLNGADATWADGSTGTRETTAPEEVWIPSPLAAGETSPVREGFTFEGWANSADATEPTYVEGTSTFGDSDLVFYAVWSKYAVPTPDPTPAPLSNGWVLDDAGWRYAVDGAYAIGWTWIDDVYGAHWYYFGEDTYMVTSEWLWDDSQASWYWVCSTGPMIQGVWQWIDNAWYGFWWDGKMCTGWVWDFGYIDWFYCYDNGVMAKDAWVNGCYVNASGLWVR